MGSPLPAVWQGYIQVEETSPKSPVSEYLQQKLGSNIEYLKAQLNQMLASIATYVAAGGLQAQFILNAPYNSTFTSPNGKPYYGGVMGIDGSNETPTYLVQGIIGVQLVVTFGYQTFDMTGGNTLVCNGPNTHTISGILLYPP